MFVHSVQSSQAAQTQAASRPAPAQKQTDVQNTLPQDKVTISAAAQPKQAAVSVGGDADHDGK